jgi:hypothetical protein
MATVKKGMLTKTGEWWKHLRETKRVFWKGERQAVKKLIRQEAAADPHNGHTPAGAKVPTQPRRPLA